MSWGIFSKLFKSKKRATSNPPGGKGKGKGKTNISKLASSLPNLPEDKVVDNVKSFGEFNRTGSMASLDIDINKSSARPTQDSIDTDVLQSKKTAAGYESSDSEDEKKSKADSLDFLNTITGSKPDGAVKRQSIASIAASNKNEDDTNSITTISGRASASQGLTLAELIKEVQEKKSQETGTSHRRSSIGRRESMKSLKSLKRLRPQSGAFEQADLNTSFLNSIVELDKNQQNVQDLIIENKNLRKSIELMQKQILDRESQEKKENDEKIIKLFEMLNREAKDEGEKQALIKLLLSKQQEKNEKIINEQSRLIDTLNTRCLRLENDLKSANDKNVQTKFKKLNNENKKLREDVDKAKKEVFEKTKIEATKLSSSAQSIENISKQMMSQKVIYEEKLNEKEEKLKLVKNKFDELVVKYRELSRENSDLHAKLDSKPKDIKNEMTEIKNQAQLVLEENKMLSQQYYLQEKKLVEIQKAHIQETGRLAKRVIVCEAERVNLLNQIDLLRANNEEVLKKYNEYSIEAQRRVKLEDHLNQTGDLKRKIEELSAKHRQEIETLVQRLQAAEDDKRNLLMKCTNLEADTKRLGAENQVLEKALNEGIGRKTQKKIQDLEAQLELATRNEAIAYKSLEKLTKQFNKVKAEKEMYENLVKENESEIKMKESQIAEENLKISRLEDRLEDYKLKTTNKLAKTMEKIKKKDADILLVQLEKEKKLAEILKLLDRKQSQIDELSNIANSSNETANKIQYSNNSLDNKKLKEILMDLKSQSTDYFF